ncbi:hypothetical protein [Eubacterium ventriosum]|uniref:hypothetical protein n=1 Tax=Eubacterium ventriosum TaxID=39496 RepID=UPI003AB8E023
MATQKLSTYYIRLNNNFSWNDIIEKIIFANTEKSYCKINEQSDNYIGGCYIYESLQNQTIYNIIKNEFETIKTTKQNIVKFDMFLLNGILLLWGSKKASTFFLTMLEQASCNMLVIDYNRTDFKTMLKRLMKDSLVLFSKMKIVDIIIDDGIIANCSVSLSNYSNVTELINKYMDSISQITVLLGQDMYGVSMTLFSSGSVVVYKDRDDIDSEVMNSINLMIGGGI